MNGIEALNSLQKKYGISDIPKSKEPQATQSAAFGTTGIKQTGNSALDALNNKYLEPVKTKPVVNAQSKTNQVPAQAAPTQKISADKAAALLAQVNNLPASNAVIKNDTRTPEQVVADNEAMQIIKDQQKPTVWSQAAARDKATSAGTFGAAITPALTSTGNPYDEDPLEKYKIEGISEDRLNAYEQAAAKSRNNLLTLAQEETNQGDFIKQYTYMTPEEKKLYNRLYGLYGKDRAEEFHNLLLDKINDRIAADKYKENIEGKSTAGKVVYSFGQGVKSGIEGLKDVPETLLGVSRTKAKPVGEYVNERLRTDEDNSTLENIAYDLAQTAGYTIPGVAASYLTGGLGAGAGTAQAVGNLVFALSQYGNTYREDINAGRDASSAGLRALQQGADEMVTNALLGGIGAFGGGALKKVLGNTKAGNALKEGLGKLAKTESGRKTLMKAGDYLADMGSEAAQEYLQYFTENLGKQILYGESDLKWDPADPVGSIIQNLASPDAWYAAALGALNAGVMNAPAAVGDAVKLKSDSNTIRTEAELDIRQRRENAEKEGKALEAYGTTDPERQVAFREAEIVANRFGNALGLSEGNTEGSYQNGKITINKNTNDPVMEVLFHELTHHLETKKDYASFAKYALDYIANDMGADIQTLKENIIKDYAEGGITLDDQGAERELVAKFTESKLFHDEAAVNRLYNTDPSLFQRIYYWIQDSVKKLTGTQEEKRLLEAQNLFQKVMKSGQAEENAQRENLYAGENSRGADLKALDMARQLDERGVPGEEIRQKTGWFKGMDGKWRYEMADNGMKTDTTGAYSRNPDIRRRNELTRMAYFDMNATEEQLQELQILEKNLKGVSSAPKYLDEVVSHPALFEAYPELRDVKVVISDDLRGTTEAAYAPGFNEIVINRNTILEKDKLKKNLIHEIQHAIQEIEGYAQGTNLEAANDALRRKTADLEASTENAEAIDKLRNTTGYDYYRNTAGEIEARDAARRRNMDTEARRLAAPDLREDVVFAGNTGMWSAEYDSEVASIKEQIENSKGILNSMDVVDSVEVPKNLNGKGIAKKWAINILKSTGYAVDRKDFGEIFFNEKDIDRGMRYADTNAEKAAFAALPKVLKRGIEIGDHSNHKNRKKETITIAAPVEMNGKRGNMAVVVNKKGNHYYAHRIVLPDGSNFTFSDNKKAELRELSRGVTVSGSLAKTTRSAALGTSGMSDKPHDFFIANNGEDVKPLPSTGAEDSQKSYGRKLDDLVKPLASPGNEQKNEITMESPVEETDRLIAVHNMNEAALKSALDLGGLAMPSFAIKTADKGHNSYGEISVIASKDTINPKNKDSEVYGGDAWTPVFPQVDAKVSSDALKSIQKRLDDIFRDTSWYKKDNNLRIALDEYNVENDLDRYRTFRNAYKNNDLLKIAYLKEKGREIPIPEIAKEYSVGNVKVDDAYLNELAGQIDGFTAFNDNNQVERYGEIIKKAKLNLFKRKYGDALAGKVFDNSKPISFSEVNNALYTLRKYANDQSKGGETQLDHKAIHDELDKAFDDETKKDFELWLDELGKDVVEKIGVRNDKDLFTPTGNRRNFESLHYDYNLANVIRVMKAQSKQGRIQAFSGPGSAKGAMLEKYKNVEDVRKDRGRLGFTEESAKEAYDSFREHMEEVSGMISDDLFDGSNAIAEGFSKTKTRAGIESYLRREWLGWGKVTEENISYIADEMMDLKEEANKLPMEYFEAKLYRAFPMNEALAYVVPDDINKSLLKEMQDNGLNVVEYEAGNDTDRLAKIRSVEGAEFSYGRSLDELVSTARPLASPGLETAEQPAAGQKTETLPAKAQTYLNRAENRLLDDITNVLGASKYADRRYMKQVAREISEEYLREGKISDESMSRLFGEAYEQARVNDEAWLNQYRGIREYIDGTTLKVSDELLSNFADPKMWQKKARAYVKMDKNGTAVDTIYQELNEMYPDLFSDDIINEADQLEKIVDVAKDLKNTERTLDNYYSEMSDEYREWQYRDFEATVSEMAGELNKVRRYSDEQTKKAEAKNITDEDIKKAYEGIHAARKNAEKVVSRNLLTDRDNAVVGKLLRGEITMDDVSKMDDVNFSGIKAVYEAKSVYEKYADVVKEAKKQRKKALREKAAGYLQNAINWKDKKAGILYMRETAERNIRDIIPDRAEAEAIIDEYFKPVHTFEAESTRYKNARKQVVKELNLDRKVREGNKVSESYAVQLVGEAEANIEALKASRYGKQRDGRTEKEWRAALSDFWAENPNLDKKKIYSAIEVFREQYNGMIEDVNKVLIRNGYEPIPYRKGYFPHFEIGETEGVFAKVKNLLGIDTEVTSLPTEINGLTGSFRPGKTWFGNALERMGINTDYDAVMGYDKYVNGISDVIHHTDNIQNLRALAQEVRYQTSDEGIRKQIDAVLENENISEEAKQAEIDQIYSKGKHVASNFVVWLDEYTNLLANKKSKLDRGVESMFGRDAYNLLKGFEGNVAANMVSLNPGSWLTNFIPLTQAWTTVSSKDMLAGMWDTLRSYKRDDGFSNLSDYLTSRKGSEDLIRSWDRDPNVKGLKAAGRQYAKAMDKASVGMEIVDNFTSEAIVRARYYQNLRSGMSEAAAISEADDFAAGIQAARSKGSMPTLFASKNPLIKLFTQFQLEVNNEFSWLMKDVPDNLKKEGLGKLAAGLFKFLIGSYLFNEIYEYFVGRRSALDPLGILNDTVGNATGYQIPNLVELATGEDRSFKTDKLSTYETASELATTVAEELPFVGGILGGGRVPISSALPDMENVAKAALNTEWSGKKRTSTLVKELAKPVLYSALPGGGGQIKKMAEGYKALAKGGSYSVDNQGNDILQYPVYKDDPKDLARAAVRTTLFGKSSLKEAREWVDSGFKSLNAKQTKFYEDLKEDGLQDREAMEFVKDFGAIKKTETESANDRKREYLKDNYLPMEVKADAYRQFASDKKTALMDALSDEDEGTVAYVLMDMESTDKKADQQKILMDSKLSGAGKLTTYNELLASDSEKELIRKLSGEKDDAVMNFLSKWNKASDAYGKAAAIKNSKLSAEGKKDAYLSKYSSEKEEEFIKNAGAKAVDALIELRLAENAQGDKKKAQYSAILDSGLNENQQIQLFMIKFGGEGEREKINAVRETGLSFTDYLNFKYYLSNVKKDDNMTKKEKVEEKIRSFGLNADQSNALWAMAGYTGQLMSGALSLAAPKLNGPKTPELKVKKLDALPLAAP